MTEEVRDRSVKDSDKLTYRIIIQRKVDYALSCLHTEELENAVIAVRTACKFNQIGLPFKTKILDNLNELNSWRRDYVLDIVKKDRDEWIHPIKRKIHLITITDLYYTAELEFLIDMLASHGALLDSKDFVERGEQDHSD